MSPHELHLHWKTKQMTDKQINAAIAKALNADEHWMIQKNYCNDLNAMHEAESWLSPIDREYYIDVLGDMFGNAWELALASARQRAEAFLKTIDKWEEA